MEGEAKVRHYLKMREVFLTDVDRVAPIERTMAHDSESPSRALDQVEATTREKERLNSFAVRQF